MFYLLLVLTCASSLSFLGYKKFFFGKLENNSSDSNGASETFITQNPVELAYLAHGEKVAFGVTIYSLCAYKYAKRTRTGGVLRFISTEEKQNPAAPYSNKMMKTISSKMNNALILNLGKNKSLIKVFHNMIVSFEERMSKHNLILSAKDVDNLRFARFLVVTMTFILGFYTLLWSTGFWTFLLAIAAVIFSLTILKKKGSYKLVTPDGEKYLKRCFQAVGRENYKAGIYALSKHGRARFNDLEMNDFLGIKTITMDDFME